MGNRKNYFIFRCLTYNPFLKSSRSKTNLPSLANKGGFLSFKGSIYPLCGIFYYKFTAYFYKVKGLKPLFILHTR